MARLFRDYPEALARHAGDRRAPARFSLDELRYEYPDETARRRRARRRRSSSASPGKAPPSAIPTASRDKVRKAARPRAGADRASSNYAPYFLTVHDIVRFARSRGHPLPGPRLGGQLRGLLLPRHHRGRPGQRRPAVRALHLRRAQRAARHRRRFRARAARGGDPVHLREIRPRPRRHRRHRHLLPRRAARSARSARRSACRATSIGALAGIDLGLERRTASTDERRRASRPRPRRPHAAHGAASSPRELIGFPRHLSQHVGGFVITREPLDELVPIENAAMEDRTVIEWDKDDLDALGILKVDVLALGMLTCIRKALRADRRSITASARRSATVPHGGPGRLRHAVPRRLASACSRSRAARR